MRFAEAGLRAGVAQLEHRASRCAAHPRRYAAECCIQTARRIALGPSHGLRAGSRGTVSITSPARRVWKRLSSTAGAQASAQSRDWAGLFEDAARVAVQAARRNAAADDDGARAARAVRLVRLGELFAANRALTAVQLAPGSDHTFAELRDPQSAGPQSARSGSAKPSSITQSSHACCAGCGVDRIHRGPFAGPRAACVG